jgi:hypothetical protein
MVSQTVTQLVSQAVAQGAAQFGRQLAAASDVGEPSVSIVSRTVDREVAQTVAQQDSPPLALF